MTQLAPSVMYYAQAIARLEEFKKDYAEGKYTTTQEITERLQAIIAEYTAKVGKPILEFEPFVKTEPAISAKMNRFLTGLEYDVNILQEQLDILRASSVFTHNYIVTEINKERNKNSSALNKLKTLQLYSSESSGNIITFGDFFIDDDFIDFTAVATSEKVSLEAPGNVTLGRVQSGNPMSNVTVRILPTSNGFAGNNQEIDTSTLVTPTTSGTDEVAFKFKAETNRRADLNAVIDSEPNTWFEYEKNFVKEEDRAVAKNYNFTYKKDDNSDPVSWADGPTDQILKLDLEFDLGSVKSINQITYIPFGLTGDKNNPVLIKSIQVSEGGTNWSVLTPENVWIATDANLQTSFNSRNISVGQATWVFEKEDARYVRISLEQSKSLTVQLGHMYYIGDVTSMVSGSYTYNEVQPYYACAYAGSGSGEYVDYDDYVVGSMGHDTGWVANPTPAFNNTQFINNSVCPPVSAFGDPLYFVSTPNMPPEVIVHTESFSYNVTNRERVEGPIPSISNPTLYHGANPKEGTMDRRLEAFTGKRWAIGIRDVEIKDIRYNPSSVLVTDIFRINGIIDRVALEADVSIPDSYPETDLWIKFFVTPNNGLDWYPISRIEDNFLGIPEIIAFNDPLPEQFRETGVKYYSVNTVVDSLRLKIEITRPDDLEATTPLVRSYKLKIHRR